MDNRDFFELEDLRESRAGGERGTGERDYVQHVRSHILTTGERIVLSVAIIVVAVIAFGNHPSSAEIEIAPPVEHRPFEGLHYHVHCEDESPYSGRSC